MGEKQWELPNMNRNQNRHVDASTLQRQSSKYRYQQQYWQRLCTLSAIEREDYLRIYDAIAQAKAITPLIRMLMDREIVSSRVFEMAKELTDLVEQLTLACTQRDLHTYRQLHTTLDDINIAVNACLQPICLQHSAFLYGQYRQLQHGARFHSTQLEKERTKPNE
jgi:hypothetical protein